MQKFYQAACLKLYDFLELKILVRVYKDTFSFLFLFDKLHDFLEVFIYDYEFHEYCTYF